MWDRKAFRKSRTKNFNHCSQCKAFIISNSRSAFASLGLFVGLPSASTATLSFSDSFFSLVSSILFQGIKWEPYQHKMVLHFFLSGKANGFVPKRVFTAASLMNCMSKGEATKSIPCSLQ